MYLHSKVDKLPKFLQLPNLKIKRKSEAGKYYY